MIRIILILFLSFPVALCAQTYQQLSEKAIEYIEMDSLSKAEELLLQALKLEPKNAKNAMLFSNLGLVQRRLGEYDKALESYSFALNFAPLAVPILLDRAAINLEMGNTDRAYTDYCQVLDEDKQNLAHYIRVHLKWDRSKRFIVGLISMVAGAALTIYSFYIQAIPGITHSTPVIEIGWAFCTINCVLLTAGTFLLFTCINRPEAPRFVTDMSKLSYGMYLMHIFWLGLWATVFKNTLELPTVAAIPCIAVTTFVCCYITTKIISFIPGSKWIIG